MLVVAEGLVCIDDAWTVDVAAVYKYALNVERNSTRFVFMRFSSFEEMAVCSSWVTEP